MQHCLQKELKLSLTQDSKTIKKISAILKKGDCIIVPTDTVYGLLCLATKESLRKIQEIKKRPLNKPVAIYLSSKKKIKEVAYIKNCAEEKIIEKLMPGRITLVLQKRKDFDYPWEKVGIRVPLSSWLRKLTQEVRMPLYATSANISGKEMEEEEMVSFFKDKVSFIKKGKVYPVPSTVLEVADDKIVVKREGVVSIWEIKRKTGEKVVYPENYFPSLLVVCTGNTCRSPMAYGFFKKLLPKIKVETAGIRAFPGDSPSPNAVKVMEEKGIDIRRHLSKRITEDKVKKSSLILVMERMHYSYIIKKWEWAKSKTFMLHGFPFPYPKGKNIQDPIGGSINFYRRIRNIIERCCIRVSEELQYVMNE